ncbi:MAG: (d)CMP kinase [Ruminococcaceae bacterium]|nr:(d)CMP kinase [Oscillospiraceae bacterium]
MKKIAIAIDGPGGAGKSTISKAVAKRLGIIYVDTGALYRTVGYYARENGLSVEDAKVSDKMSPLLPNISIEIEYVEGTQHVILNGEDLGDKIREPDISMYASAVSSVPCVRAFLLAAQKDLAAKNSVIMDGRDIGTVILPEAEVKVFMTATNEARAERRYKELMAKGVKANFEDVLRELIERDTADSTRAAAPLKPAHDAIIFDNSEYDFDGSVEYIIKIVYEKTGVKASEE